MNTKLKLAVEEAIDKAIQDNAENSLWDGYIHDNLTAQMADAAATVFDASMEGQAFSKSEDQ